MSSFECSYFQDKSWDIKHTPFQTEEPVDWPVAFSAGSTRDSILLWNSNVPVIYLWASQEDAFQAKRSSIIWSLQKRIQGALGPGPPCPQDFFKSCSFQAILREKSLFWAHFGLRPPPLGSKLCWAPLTKILDPRLYILWKFSHCDKKNSFQIFSCLPGVQFWCSFTAGWIHLPDLRGLHF